MKPLLLSRTGQLGFATLSYIAAVVAAFVAAGVFIAAMGFPVLDAYATIVLTSFRSMGGFISTLNRFVPLLLQALAFSVPLAAWKFNIGGEGQLLLGAVGAAAVGILLRGLPPAVLLPLALVVGTAFGALWAAVAAILLDRFKINEILTTVLLNFVSFELVHYIAGEVWTDPAAGHPTTVPIDTAARLPLLLTSPRLHAGLLLAVLCAIAVATYVRMTPGGYELRATGANERAAAVFGIRVRRIVVGALVVGGCFGGLSGAVEVVGVHYKLIEGMQSNFLLLGIIIGLIARGNLLAVPFVAFAISVLEVGASATQRTIGLPAEMVLIVVGLILLFVLLSDLVRNRLRAVPWMSS
jgi:general nucleoside transport system permease protein